MSQTRIEFNTSRHAEPPVLEGWYRCRLVRAERNSNFSGAHTYAEPRRLTGLRATGLDGIVVDDSTSQSLPELRQVIADRYLSSEADAALLVGRGSALRGTGTPPWTDLGPQPDESVPVTAEPVSAAHDGADVGPASAARDGGAASDRPPYAMFTSGATDEPKAVGMGRDAPHGFAPAAARPGLGPEDRWLQLAVLGLDMVVEELLRVLTRGGTVVCRPRTGVPAPEDLPGALGVTTEELSTQYWHEYAHWLDGRGGVTPAAPRRVLVGGERPDADGRRRWERARLVHVYGVTDCTVISILDEGRLPDDAPEVPIGTPFANAEVSVRDSGRRPVPPGTVGEIHIGGPSPTPGHLGDPERTVRRFVTGPEPGGGRLYAIGDLGRILPDGNVEFHGWADDRIRIRGHGLEPASVERLPAAASAVAQAVVPVDTRTRGALPACPGPVDPRDAPGHRTPRRLPRDRRTAGHDRPRPFDIPPARPVALRGADPPPPDAGPVPTSLT